MPVTCPAACRCFTTIYLSSGNTSAKPSAPAKRSTVLLPTCALAPSDPPRAGCWATPRHARFRSRPPVRHGEHLYRNAEVVECGDELPGVRRGGSYNDTNPTKAGAPVSGPRATAASIALRGRRADAHLQRLDCRGWSPQASAMVRTAPFITRSRCPFCSTTASVRGSSHRTVRRRRARPWEGCRRCAAPLPRPGTQDQ